jgi:hypothetical protein
MKCTECYKKEMKRKAKRAAYDRKWYLANREKKIAAVKARYVPVDQQDVAYWKARNWEL